MLPLAANHDATRLMTLGQAKTAHQAARQLRDRIGARLPIDVITTYYPDASHSVLLNVAFPPAVRAALTADARRARQTPESFLELALYRALAEHADQETDCLDRAVRQLLAHTSPAYLLAAVGHALTRLPERPTPVNPTDEQTAAADAFHTGDHVSLQAGAGTGKTTTLALLAHTTTRRGRYLAYNRAIAQNAAARFPTTVQCKTAHALAYAAVGHRYTRRLNAPRRPAWQTGQALGITKALRIGDRYVAQKALSNATLRTVTRLCHTADEAIIRHHVPCLRGLEEADLHAQLATHIVPFARKARADLQHPDDGCVRFDHDHYLKIWALTRPLIQADFLLLDEAQDTNPVVEPIFLAQRDHAQLVMVGDSAQAIYHWRGAKGIMTSFDGTQLALSQSFRFGPDLAAEANRWLHLADAPIRLTGTPALATEVGPVTQPDAVLCRTNVGAMAQVMTLMATGYQVALAGGGDSLQALALAARGQEPKTSLSPSRIRLPFRAARQDRHR